MQSNLMKFIALIFVGLVLFTMTASVQGERIRCDCSGNVEHTGRCCHASNGVMEHGRCFYERDNRFLGCCEREHQFSCIRNNSCQWTRDCCGPTGGYFIYRKCYNTFGLSFTQCCRYAG
ncbi:unnamed protein product [Adineta steineri]|uniref:Uncharacterized protein n=1 Tax=Adineta steineri TaxID=433720 RepID=A0A818S4L9_9BILA|nr:unnamed protein product [Adineta steineri]CAF3666519.1 unnamed protein product [Adineta steineri]